MAQGPSLYETAVLQFERAADATNLTPYVREILRHPKNEVLVNFPGVGIKLRDAVTGHDAAAVQFLSIFVSGIYVVVNLLADVGTILVTPRLRTTFA